MSNDRMMARMLAPIARRVGNMLARGMVTAVDSSGGMQRLQVTVEGDEAKDAIEHVEPYGFTAAPLIGAEKVSAYLDGDRGHGVVLTVCDRRYRLRNLAGGEVAVYDDQGQSVHLTRTGIVVRGAGKPMLITDTPMVTIEAALHVTGPVTADATVAAQGNVTSEANITAAGDVADAGGAHTARGMREIYDEHDHAVRAVHGGSDTVTTDGPVPMA